MRPFDFQNFTHNRASDSETGGKLRMVGLNFASVSVFQIMFRGPMNPHASTLDTRCRKPRSLIEGLYCVSLKVNLDKPTENVHIAPYLVA